MNKKTFTRADIGCHADGAFGHDHCRGVLADLAENLYRLHSGRPEPVADEDLIASLRGPMPDDAWDEIEAIDLLMDATEDGLVWVFDSGDLLLVEDEAPGSIYSQHG